MDATNRVSARILPTAASAVAAMGLLLCGCGGGGDTGGVGNGPGGGGTNFNNGLNDPVALSEVDLDFTVSNTTSVDRHETISASIPFPEGAVNNLGQLGVPGYATTWMPMQSWANGSVRVAQVQFTDTVPANTDQTYRVEEGQQASGDPFGLHPWVANRLSQTEIGARVHDTFNHRYQSVITGDGETLQSSPLKRVRRWRTYHESVSNGGIGRDYLASTFYVTEFRDTPFLIIDWVFGNDYLGRDDTAGSTDPNMFPLGPVDVNNVAFLSSGFAEVTPYRANWHGISPQFVDGGRTVNVVMDNTWLGDGQSRRYRFFARIEDPNASANDKQLWRDRFEGFREGPMNALAHLEAWQKCRSFGLLGGPVNPPTNAASRAESGWGTWSNRTSAFGTWGPFGDVKGSAVTGTPRNTPLSIELAHAAQSGDLRLLTILEHKAWAQACRPYHMFGLDVGIEEDVMLLEGVPQAINNQWDRDLSPQSYGRRALKNNDPWLAYRSRMETSGRPHGWNAYDRSHWTSDLLFDHWTASGDAWAQEELRLLGQCLVGLQHYHGNLGSQNVGFTRAEGWTMQSFVQCYLATGDSELKAKAVRRTYDVIDAQRDKTHPGRAIRIDTSDHPQFPGNSYTYYVPWQSMALFYGYLGAFRIFDDPIFLTIAEDAVLGVSYAWMENYLDQGTGEFYPFAIRYACHLEWNGNPVSPDHLDMRPNFSVARASSTGEALATGMLHVAAWTHDAAIAAEARRMAHLLVPTLHDQARWDKWTFLMPEYEYPN